MKFYNFVLKLLKLYMMKVSKNRFLQAFGIITVILALVRCAFPQIAGSRTDSPQTGVEQRSDTCNVLDTLDRAQLLD